MKTTSAAQSVDL